jgi:hypothetical protein
MAREIATEVRRYRRIGFFWALDCWRGAPAGLAKCAIRILPADKDMVEVSPNDLSKGRITFRPKLIADRLRGFSSRGL